jgi:uncharacterized protein
MNNLLSILFIMLVSCKGSVQDELPVELVLPVQFASTDGALLEGTLELPAKTGTHPLVVFVHGSGRTTRSDYQDIADLLLQKGYAVFRYDKRGVGASQGIYSGVSAKNSVDQIPLLAADAASAINNLKKNRSIDAKKIILIGASQAGWIIPAAANLTEVSFTICISGPTVTVGEEIFYSKLAETGSYPQDQADQMLKDFTGFKGYDPIPNVKTMNKPSLWIFGGKDVSIPIKRTIELLDSTKTAQHLPVEMVLFPNADHGIFNISTRTLENYYDPMLSWLKANSN